MIDEEVLPESGQPTETGDESTANGGGEGQPKAGNPDKAETRKVHEENARLKREATEARAQADYWSKRAQQEADRKPDPKAKTDDAEDDDPDKFIDALTKEGPKALKKYMKPGASLDEIGELIDKKLGGFTNKLTKQGQLAQSYPELTNPESRLSQLTQEEAAAILKRSPDREGDEDVYFDAARMASLRLKNERDEEDRARRVRSQSGYGGETFDDDDLTGGGPPRLTSRDKTVAMAMGIGEGELKSVLAHKQAIHAGRKGAKR